MIPVTSASTDSPLFQWAVILSTILNCFSWRPHDHLCTKSKNCILDYKSPCFLKTFFSCFYSCTFFLIWGTAEVSVFGHVLHITVSTAAEICPLIDFSTVCQSEGFPGDASGKESTCQAGDASSIAGSGSPLEKEMATQSSILAWRIPRQAIGHGIMKEVDATW